MYISCNCLFCWSIYHFENTILIFECIEETCSAHQEHNSAKYLYLVSNTMQLLVVFISDAHNHGCWYYIIRLLGKINILYKPLLERIKFWTYPHAGVKVILNIFLFLLYSTEYPFLVFSFNSFPGMVLTFRITFWIIFLVWFP